MEEIKFALDTFYAIMSGALVMWMAAGFTMLEAGLVQKKDVSEIVTKNLGLFFHTIQSYPSNVLQISFDCPLSSV